MNYISYFTQKLVNEKPDVRKLSVKFIWYNTWQKDLF